MTHDANARVFREIVDIWQTGDPNRLDDYIATDYIGHVAAGDRDGGGLRSRIVAFRALFPDIIFSIHDQLIDGDRVATRMTARGTHQPTGKPVTLTGLNISRFIEGKIVEEWAVWESMAEIAQAA